MTWRTHLLGGFVSLSPLALVPGALTTGSGLGNAGLLALVAGIGALLPDLDASESKIKHLTVGSGLGIAPFAPASVLLHRAFGHRGFLHSLAGWGMATLLLGVPLVLWLGWPAALALSLGYLSHLLLDGCTKAGVPLFYPRLRRINLLPVPLRVTTGTAAEDLWLAGLALASAALFLGLLAHS